MDISNFKKKYSIKGKGLGGDLQGPTLKGLMKDENKLKELEDIISQNDENMVLYTEHLRNLHKLNEVANSKNLDIDYAKYVIYKLKLLYFYDLSQTLKMHILCDHYEDYLELTGETLH